MEECLTTFNPGDPSLSKCSEDEHWAAGGEACSYGRGEETSAYHLVEPIGGFVHADSRVRVSYVPDGPNGGNAIFRLQVVPHACPPAPDRK